MTIQETILSLLNASVEALEKRKEEINRLNVFPVPDGDTGTNMLQTMQSVVSEARKASNVPLNEVLNAITYGSLMGARGNSGVILSQIIKGVCEELGRYEEISSGSIAKAVANGSKVAYQAVTKPVEGTMLTVVKDMARIAESPSIKDLRPLELLELIVNEGIRSVERTPFLLPILKEAGVVDAGGHGLVTIAQGLLSSVKGEEIEAWPDMSQVNIVVADQDIKFAYCTEFVLKSSGIDMGNLEGKLSTLGDSVLVVGTPELTKVHVHTNDPGEVIRIATDLGSISDVQINNIIEQSEARSKAVKAQSNSMGGISIVAVANGKGIKDILLNLGVTNVVNGGQSMNPSTSDIVEAINNSPGREVIVLPNNKNIILTAQQAIELTDKKVAVIPTKSIPEAFAALMSYNKDASFKENLEAMGGSVSDVITAEITYAIRDGNNGDFRKNDYIGIYNSEIKASGSDLLQTTLALINEVIDDAGAETLTILSGEQVSEEEEAKLCDMLETKFPDIELDIHRGDQPVYYFIIGAE